MSFISIAPRSASYRGVDHDTVLITIRCEVLAEHGGVDVDRIETDEAPTTHAIRIPFALKRRGIEARFVIGDASPSPDAGLVKLIARSHIYARALTCGSAITIAELARREQLDVSDLSRILRLAYLARESPMPFSRANSRQSSHRIK